MQRQATAETIPGITIDAGILNDLRGADRELSDRLVDARPDAGVMNGFHGESPTRIDQARVIQCGSIARWPDGVAGWRVPQVPTDSIQLVARPHLAFSCARRNQDTKLLRSQI